MGRQKIVTQPSNSPRLNPRQGNRIYWLIIGVTIALFIVLFSISPLIHLLTESWWFTEVGFSQVFWLRFWGQSLSWLMVFLLTVGFWWANYRYAMFLTRYSRFQFVPPGGSPNLINYTVNLSALVAIGVIALGVAGFNSEAWLTILKAIHATPFNQTDPLYQKDVSFYFFQLPLYEGLRNLCFTLIVGALAISIPVYVLKGSLDMGRGLQNLVVGPVKTHLMLLLAALILLVAAGTWLDRFQLLYSPSGVVFGAGYTDTHSRLLGLNIMAGVGVLVAGAIAFLAFRNGLLWMSLSLGGYLLLALIFQGLIPSFEQQFSVTPNELTRERPYIEHNLTFTRHAYGLDDIATIPYPVEDNLTRQDLETNEATIRNIRLWDYRPILSTYRQLQEIRLYYRFNDVDVDRYTLNGNYRQVMLSGRELAYRQVPERAQTWVNERLKYTHGYGAVMSPVNQVTPQGLPHFFIKDIPPVSEVDIPLDQPRIYYGEETQHYIFTGMGTDEFDYPLGNDNAAYRYTGKGGVPLKSWWHRLAYALDFNNLKTLISGYFTPDSRILYHREITDRVGRIAPFLTLDHDPYLVLREGRMQWVIDAYTMGDRYPYSEPLYRLQRFGLNPVQRKGMIRGFNYMRNSVKVLVDAYDGTVQFFAVDEQDPLLATYRQIFPDLFINQLEVPDDLRSHFRYPLDLFFMQAQMYLVYHMTNPEVFYNQEDLWRFPIQQYEGKEEVMQPYYLIMRLPDSEQEEFLLVLPFTPGNRDNMIAWMATRCDGENYGSSLLYEFPKQELVYGPRQIEARIDQDPVISPQLTLWSQEGSRVIRGDLFIIPIEQSLLYVEPVFLRSEQGGLPELKRVIVVFGEKIVMEETLEQALNAVFGVTPVSTPAPTPVDSTLDPDLARQALETYQQAQDALRNGNWAEYGRLHSELEQLLLRLNQ
ncbi:UPF0182 family protein [Spirulina subsalsa]|uniref:UPF0182 family membrane protein n=1 Tax=Spirulina subsalsa TaxID=54311 RepID=UPI0002F8216D